MQQSIHKKTVLGLSVLILAVLGIISMIYFVNVQGSGMPGSASPVELDKINYEEMELTVKTNGNAIVYYSTDRKKWYEAEMAIGGGTGTSDTLTYDISWISASTTKTLYFRGNVDKTTLDVKIPGYNKSFKVKFDKAAGDFDFQNTDGGNIVRWRKTTDYDWHYVDIEKSTGGGTGAENAPQSLDDFQKAIDELRVKSVKLIFQIAPVEWESEQNQGSRPSKDVKVTVPAKKAAPSVKINVKKLNVNTKTTQEWTKENPLTVSDDGWFSCSKTMKLEELADKAVAGTVSEEAVYIRTAATSSNSASKVTALTVPGRENAPELSSVLGINYTPGKTAGKGKVAVSFQNVPSQGFEYIVMTSGTLTDETTAKWKTIKKSKTVKFSESKLPVSSIIYVRVAGTTENVKKGIKLTLPSKCAAYTVNYAASTGESK